MENHKTIHWANLKEAGTFKGILFLLWVHRIFGRTIFSIILIPVMAYFFCFVPVARRASREYLNLHFTAFPHCWKKSPGYFQVYLHLYAFGQAVLDKLLAWSLPMTENEFDIVDEEQLLNFMEKQNGQLIIGSHIGNLEYCRGFVQRYKEKTINVLVYDQHSANFVKAMLSLNEESRVNVFQVDTLDIPTILKLKTKVDAGEWIFIAGDRVPLSGEERTVPVSFLGKTASLPIGPYILAKVLQCEVQLMFSFRNKGKVVFDLVPFSEKIVIPRKENGKKLQELAQKFASEMEKQLVKAPYQWFNFYPYWEKQKEADLLS